MGIGVKGYVYRGWVVADKWDAARGYKVFAVTNPERPGQSATFARPAEAERWIDAQELGTPQAAKVERPTQRNRYGARCLRCGQYVNPGQGVLLDWSEAERQGLRLPNRPGYIVVHVECPPPTAEEQRRARDAAAAARLCELVEAAQR